MPSPLSLARLLTNAAHLTERSLHAALRNVDISHCQASALLLTAERERSMSQLGRQLCCGKSNVSQIVGGLVERGLIEVYPCHKDRRVTHLRLTARGACALRRAEGRMRAAAGERFVLLRADEKSQLAGMLKRLVG